MRSLTILTLGLLSVMAVGQSPFQDARGNSSILLGSGGYAQIALDKSSARLGFLRDTDERTFYGIDLLGKLRGDSAGIFGKDNLVNDARLQGSYGIRLQKPLKLLVKNLEDQKYPLQKKQADLKDELKQNGEDTLLLTESKDAFDDYVDDLKKKKSVANRVDGKELDKKIKHAEDLSKMREDPTQKAAEVDRLSKNQPLLEELIKQNDDAVKMIESMETSLGQSPYQVLAIQFSGRAASYKLFDAKKAFADQFHDERFEGWGLSAVYSGLLPALRYGVSIGLQRDNNIDDLSLSEVDERQTFVDGGITRTIDKKVNAYQGKYDTVDRVPLNADLVWWPKGLDHRIGINLYTRMDLRDSGSFRPGIGLFLSKAGAPTAVIGGLTMSLSHGKPQAAIIAGYSF